MNCFKCGAEADSKAKFCTQCGASLVKRCPICRTVLSLSAKFCCECGVNLERAESEQKDKLAYKYSIPVPKESGHFVTDLRDGQIYRTTKVGNQLWLAENFRFNSSDSYAYANSLSNVERYGRLYTWSKAKFIAPPGWHLPTREDFRILANFCVSNNIKDIGSALKSNSPDWKQAGLFGEGVPGNNALGFSAIPGGCRTSAGVFNYLGNFCYFWCADEHDADRAYSIHLRYFNGDVQEIATRKECAFSVRFVKD